MKDQPAHVVMVSSGVGSFDIGGCGCFVQDDTDLADDREVEVVVARELRP